MLNSLYSMIKNISFYLKCIFTIDFSLFFFFILVLLFITSFKTKYSLTLKFSSVSIFILNFPSPHCFSSQISRSNSSNYPPRTPPQKKIDPYPESSSSMDASVINSTRSMKDELLRYGMWFQVSLKANTLFNQASCNKTSKN